MDLKKEAKDPEHRECRKFLKGKKCEFCSKLFADLIEKKGLYFEIDNPPELTIEDKEEFIRNAQGFVRGKMVCGKHFRIFRAENKFLHEAGIEIIGEFKLRKIRKSHF